MLDLASRLTYRLHMSIVKSNNVDQIATDLVSETFKLIEGQSKSSLVAERLSVVFLAKFIGVLMYKNLTTETPYDVQNDTDKIAKFTITRFGKFKGIVQEAIAAAFSGAMQSYSGQDIEYYCQVRPIGQAVNKEPI